MGGTVGDAELDGLFIEPSHWWHGIGRALSHQPAPHRCKSPAFVVLDHA